MGHPFHQADVYQTVDGATQSAFVQTELIRKRHASRLSQLFNLEYGVALRQGDPLAATFLFKLLSS